MGEVANVGAVDGEVLRADSRHRAVGRAHRAEHVGLLVDPIALPRVDDLGGVDQLVALRLGEDVPRLPRFAQEEVGGRLRGGDRHGAGSGRV